MRRVFTHWSGRDDRLPDKAKKAQQAKNGERGEWQPAESSLFLLSNCCQSAFPAVSMVVCTTGAGPASRMAFNEDPAGNICAPYEAGHD
ncbi:unnamed protein product [Protopolystoma xenopodis]|uniref:Uncharacterized protein n=1 Tax=Protopolystoma xenopodis TaxID=117903 RepID=A0A448X016_9PLAT|nr:unnamed protein product [Protopolystoma xenopodis]